MRLVALGVLLPAPGGVLADSKGVPTLERDVEPILTRHGCNAGACHGKQRGQNGFQLSLLGFDPSFDLDALAHEARGRRIFPAAPERSLVLLKATARVLPPTDQFWRDRMSPRTMIMNWCIASLFWAVTPSSAQEHHKGHSAADLNKQFQDPDLDVGRFVDRFETDSREIFAQRQKIVEAVGLHSGQALADIGAGTGLFSWMFAEKVGPRGTVYAVEIAPAFLKFIGEQARKRGLEKVVKVVRSTQETTNLAPGSIDVAFVCATYHHFEHPGKVLASIHRSLRPGGRLVVIDFDLRQDSSAFVRERARAPKEVYFREIEAAGFVPIDAKPSLELKENFFAAFRCRESDTQHSPGSRRRVNHERSER